MTTCISSKGQIVLPAEIRNRDGIVSGEAFAIERLDRGDYRITRVEEPANAGLVDWLLACPDKGFFTPVESEGTDTL